jgi:hypothetical protein
MLVGFAYGVISGGDSRIDGLNFLLCGSIGAVVGLVLGLVFDVFEMRANRDRSCVDKPRPDHWLRFGLRGLLIVVTLGWIVSVTALPRIEEAYRLWKESQRASDREFQ